MWICIGLNEEEYEMSLLFKNENFNVVHSQMKADFENTFRDCLGHDFDPDDDDYGYITDDIAWVSDDDCHFTWQMFEV